jgi:hypothetical protein
MGVTIFPALVVVKEVLPARPERKAVVVVVTMLKVEAPVVMVLTGMPHMVRAVAAVATAIPLVEAELEEHTAEEEAAAEQA